CVQTQLFISPFGGEDCTPRFLNPPIQNACLFQPWIHNPGAYDSDGDSLSFETRVCLGAGCEPIDDYRFPNEIGPSPDNTYSIDPVTGTITWDAPQELGIYNIAFVVKEWRRTPSGIWQMIGFVMRDMQVIVVACDNEPPVLQAVQDTCVEAGTVLTFGVQASDPNTQQIVTLASYGGPFEVPNSPAVFNTAPGQGTSFGTFSWNTQCSHVRQQPYQAIFRAQDNYSPVQLQDVKTMFITVVAPAPQDPVAVPNASVMELSWSPSTCTNATGYRIYRRQGLYGFDPDHCETDVPAYTGYVFIGSTTGLNSTTYTDQSLAFGIEYCYMVVATFPDGARSYASVEFCGMLERDVPVMTKVSVVSTDNTNGADSVQWSNAYDLDATQYPGPYQFKVYRGIGYTDATQEVFVSSLSNDLQHPDTNFVDNGLDTRTVPHVYRVELFSNGDLVGSSNAASSPFLTLAPNDEQITLTIQYNTPWLNTQFDVYREVGGVFTFIGSSTTPTYIDTGLVNGQQYCYKVQTRGAYSDPDITSPLLNFSQETCASPVDLTPPCVPTLTIDNDCELPLNTLTWTNPNSSCADDTYRYHIWFTDSLGGELQLIATITGAEDTTFTHTDGLSVAGCYAVSAIDTVGNESALTDTVCGDNCPVYTLPNIFTPNRDGSNDAFIPFPYRGVKEIDLNIFNRWGQVVFRTDDPAIGWPGTLLDSNEPVPDGVYFYTCVVTLARLSGPEPLVLKGYVHLLRTNAGPTN
ncbi:MAG TPA: gliding motility-associated C-terminal domain-containing protein, partial [Flavobacteriales bacterium]